MESGKDNQGSDQPNSSDKGLVSNPTHGPAEGHYMPQPYNYPPLLYHSPRNYPPYLVRYPPQLGSYPPQQGVYPPQQGVYPPQQGGFPPYQASYPPPTYGHAFGNPSDGYPASSAVLDKGAAKDCESSFKTEDKKGQLRWNPALDNVLLDVLVEAAREGKKTGKRWDADVWNKLLATLSDKASETVKSAHVENRIRQMRNEYTSFVELKLKSGVSYDPTKQTIKASDDYWKELLSNPKDKKKFKGFRDRGLKWDYEKLSAVIGNSHATGSYTLNGLDEETEKNGEEESVDLEASEETISTTSCKKRKREHGRRVRAVDEVKNMLEGVNEHLALLRETIDPLTFAKQLREAVMGVKGFSHKYLSTAFKILMKNRVESEIFLLTDEEDRVDILTDMIGQIGDV